MTSAGMRPRVRHIVTIAPGPLADRRTLLAIDCARAPARAGRPSASATANAPSGIDPLLQIATRSFAAFLEERSIS